MNEEWYDVLSPEGKPMRRATWTEVHEKGLLHRVVAIFIFKDQSKQEVLLQRRSRRSAQDAGKWNSSAGGHVLTGEKPFDALRRELKEELFADHKLPRVSIAEVTSFPQQDIPGNNEILHLYELIYSGPFYFDVSEVEEKPLWVKWEYLMRDVQKRPDYYSNSFKNSVSAYLSSKLKDNTKYNNR